MLHPYVCILAVKYISTTNTNHSPSLTDDTLTLVTAVSLDAGKANLCDVPSVKEQVVMNKYH